MAVCVDRGPEPRCCAADIPLRSLIWFLKRCQLPIEVPMPRLSDTMQQGTIVKWSVREGQKVKSGDVIADIETDKATMELQSFDDGTVAQLTVPEGQSVKVGTIIMLIAGAGESVEDAKKGGAAAVAPAPIAAA